MAKKITQWVILVAMLIIAGFSVIVLLGEEATSTQLSSIEFLMLKAIGMFALVGLYKTYTWLDSHDLMPKFTDFINKLHE